MKTELETVVDAIWTGLSECGNGFVDPEMDCIDVHVDMKNVAEMVLNALDEYRCIETLEQLRAISAPAETSLNGPVIRCHGIQSLGEFYEMNSAGSWDLLSGDARRHAERLTPEQIPLPAWLCWTVRQV